MNDFDPENRPRDRGNNGRDRERGGGGRGRRDGRGRGEMNFGYTKENDMQEQPFRTRRPRGVSNYERNDRSFRNQRADFGFEAPQFRSYENPQFFREGFFEGRGRGWGRGGGQRYPRGGNGGGYIRNRTQDNYYNDTKFQGANRSPDVGGGYIPGQDGGRRRRRQSEGVRRYDNNNEGGYERKRYGDDAIRSRYRGRGRGGYMRNNNFERGTYDNRGGQGRRMHRYQPNSGRRGQRRNQRGGNQRTGKQEEKKVPFLNETVQIQTAPDAKSDVDVEIEKKEKPENAGQFTLHYWDVSTIENLPPL